MGDDLSSKFNDIQELFGQLGGSRIALTSLAPTAHKLSPDNPNSEAAKDKQRRTFEDILRAANDYIEQLRKDIEDMERGFRARDGDAWREKLALRILGEDDIPQRRPAESMDDYRERLEPILIAQMLNSDGSIKRQYLNDPELGDYAQWAQKKYHFNVANGYVQKLNDRETPLAYKERIYEALKRNTNIEEAVFTDRGLAQGSDEQGQVKDIADDNHDENLQANHSSELNEFLKLKS